MVVAPDLVFTTTPAPEDPEPAGDRRIPFEVDGEIFFAVRPKKLAEVLAKLSRAAARQANDADRLWAVFEFLDKVLDPESAFRLQARMDDEGDDFGVLQMFGIMEKLVTRLGGKPAAVKPAPARRSRR